MNQLLKSFYNNENQREAVKTFLIESLKELAVEMTFDGKDVTGIKEAHDAINKAFDSLAETYGIIDPPVINNSR